jgi:hypothetical protein
VALKLVKAPVFGVVLPIALGLDKFNPPPDIEPDTVKFPQVILPRLSTTSVGLTPTDSPLRALNEYADILILLYFSSRNITTKITTTAII